MVSGPPPGEGRDRRKGGPRYIAGIREDHKRYKPVTSYSRNSRLILPLWPLISGRKVKKKVENRISVDGGVPPRPARGAPLSLPAARWPPAGSGPAVRSGGDQA